MNHDYQDQKQKYTTDKNFVNNEFENSADPDSVWLTGDPGSVETIIKTERILCTCPGDR